MEVGGDIDMFMFEPAQANRYRVNTSGDLDTYCRVLDEDGESLAGNDDAWDIWDPELPDDLGVNCGIVVDLAADTTYYFKVEGLHGGVVGAYGVHIELFPGLTPTTPVTVWFARRVKSAKTDVCWANEPGSLVPMWIARRGRCA